MTQKEQVIKHLKKYRGLTSMTAFEKYGITRLASAIHELRHHDGYNILSVDKTVTNRYGDKCRVAEYRLVK